MLDRLESLELKVVGFEFRSRRNSDSLQQITCGLRLSRTLRVLDVFERASGIAIAFITTCPLTTLVSIICAITGHVDDVSRKSARIRRGQA
ncbi:MAG: hypothetical protein DMF63_07265 [Acidobacteria bacterium]|nr:MAG: hypothetical protein DMF63_07265 [Acidobacteriota bacterium]